MGIVLTSRSCLSGDQATGRARERRDPTRLRREVSRPAAQPRRTAREPPSAGLVREDGKILYPIADGIPVMLIEESIEL